MKGLGLTRWETSTLYELPGCEESTRAFHPAGDGKYTGSYEYARQRPPGAASRHPSPDLRYQLDRHPHGHGHCPM